MKYSREHTTDGHSEYQDAILLALEEAEKFVMSTMPVQGGIVTVISNGRLAASFLMHPDYIGDSDEEICKAMNEYLGRAYLFFFGTEFDGSIESE